MAQTDARIRVCAVSFKECWKDANGRWHSNGGFPLQMSALASLFDEMTLLITESDRPGEGGLRLPSSAEVIVLRKPVGRDLRRKISVLSHLFYYISTIARHAARADCVHVPPPGDLPFLGMLVALVLRKRLIVRYCGSWAETSRTTLMNRLTRGLMRVFAGGRNVMLATGEAQNPPATGIHWIFATGLSKQELRLIEPIRERGLSNPARVAYIGRLSVEKGVGNLIETLSLLRQQGLRPLPTILVIGDGPDRRQLERLVAENELQSHFHFAGQLDREKLNAALGEADFCVQPSLSEGYSKAWLDAFAHGLPVLASNAGAARNVIGTDRGWLVPAGDVEALAMQLRRVLTEPQDWPALRRRCREFVEPRTLEAWAERIARICAEQWNGRLVEGKLLA